MFKELIEFVNSSTEGQFKAFQVKANAITGDVIISQNVTPITDALKNRLGLKTVQTSLARKLAYASTRRHYKDGTTMMEDILAGKTRRHANSYI
ncbi:hypothetical protein [Streptococcus pneumoniae]|uniref:Uncharacterized protein n=2 Tax=Streptococcus pneumoniae TaxID=1313 RepID=A0A064C4C4_STREE|nr:hypothetical protein [Streptococcus pneumoniae]ETE02448.1 hypothetical protein U756_04960 [Streptococcus pneumoniae 27]ETE17879.1 hypothetical protein U754_01860 [Streptococcus pneumoniae 13856]ETE27461.1 hypothetical protein U755_03225 [Streptococcus pneumoniae 1719]OYL07761.1 hypothetical protein AK86_06500 [Streptococcus pneumoniae B1599]OYL11967.1 hypothetical protein AK85_02480 [Streptococcus pneumoniae B1598]